MAHGELWTTMAPFVSQVVPANEVGNALAVVFSDKSLGMAIGAPRSLAGAPPSSSCRIRPAPDRSGTVASAVVLMTVWGAVLGEVGIYNQAAILRAGGEYQDAANGLTVLTIQLGITVGALYGSAALVLAGPLMVPITPALPVVVAAVITLAGKRHAYPPGRKEFSRSEPKRNETGDQH